MADIERPNLERIFRSLAEPSETQATQDLSAAHEIIDDPNEPDWEKLKELHENRRQALGMAEAVVTLLPTIQAALDEVGVGDVANETIVYMAEEIKNKKQIPLEETVYEGTERIEATFYDPVEPEVKETANPFVSTVETLFKNDENVIEKRGQSFLKRNALYPYFTRSDGEEATDSAKNQAIGKFYDAWRAHNDLEVIRAGITIVLTKDEAANLAGFIASPPEGMSLPKYTFRPEGEDFTQKKTNLP